MRRARHQPPHEATTAQLCAAYPFVLRRHLPGGGVLVGQERSGGLFVHDPFELYRAGVLTNPNMLVLGQVGRGKSAFVKSYLYRHFAFSRRIAVVDPKGEYGALAAALGVTPLALRPFGELRCNPLDLVRGRGSEERRRAEELIGTLASALLARPLSALERALLSVALGSLGERALLDELVGALLFPLAAALRELNVSPRVACEEGRELALALRRLVAGDLAGMFDESTSRELMLSGDQVVFDLSQVQRSDALGVAVVVIQALLEHRAVHEPRPGLVVFDEAWALFESPAAQRFLQSSLKLARAKGVANLIVTHRLSDLALADTTRTSGLLADCETVVCYAQSESEVARARDALGLSATEARLLPRLGRGVALWRVGGDAHLVEHRLSPAERAFTDTDQALVGSQSVDR